MVNSDTNLAIMSIRMQRSKRRVEIRMVTDLRQTFSSLHLSKREAIVNKMQKSIHEIERQMGQMASFRHTRPAGALPNNTEKNPKKVMAISLRNGKELSISPPSHEEDEVVSEAEPKCRRKI
ncbi:hypothetical protein HAX54_041450, partial [Datura stramonium]|nr:hypothetical protein [Datura stramonium]